MTSHVDGNDMVIRQVLDGLIPASRMKSGGMNEQDSAALAAFGAPFEPTEANAVHIDIIFRAFIHPSAPLYSPRQTAVNHTRNQEVIPTIC